MSLLFDDASSEMLRWTTVPVTGAPFSMFCWGKSDANNINQDLLNLADSGTNTNYFSMRFTNGGRFEFIVSAGATVVNLNDGTQGQTTGIWHCFVAVERTPSDRSIFAPHATNGTITETTDTTSATPSSIDSMGVGGNARSNAPAFEMSGSTYWAAIWDVALTPPEAHNLIRGSDPYGVRRSHLRRYVPCNQPAAKSRDVVASLLVDTVDGSPVFSYDNPVPLAYLGARGRGRLARV